MLHFFFFFWVCFMIFPSMWLLTLTNAEKAVDLIGTMLKQQRHHQERHC